MHDNEPTVRSRELGTILTKAMQRKGLNARQLARELCWDPSRMSRLLTGKRGVKDVDLAAFLALCDVTGPRRDHALELSRCAWEQVWWQEYGKRLPVHLYTLDRLEADATAVVEAAIGHVPMLLQTESYLRASLRSLPIIPDDEMEARVAKGLLRQEIIDRVPAVRFEFFVHEHALTRHGPGSEVMCEQLHHLLRIALRPSVAIRVVPETPGTQVAFKPFQILEFAEFNPVVYLEFLNSIAFVERQDTLAAYRRVVEALDKAALDPNASRMWLTTAAADLATRLTNEGRDASSAAGPSSPVTAPDSDGWDGM